MKRASVTLKLRSGETWTVRHESMATFTVQKTDALLPERTTVEGRIIHYTDGYGWKRSLYYDEERYRGLEAALVALIGYLAREELARDIEMEDE